VNYKTVVGKACGVLAIRGPLAAFNIHRNLTDLSCLLPFRNRDDVMTLFFYRCTVHLDNVKIPFYQQMHLLLNI
jgi:hypothetical protein